MNEPNERPRFEDAWRLERWREAGRVNAKIAIVLRRALEEAGFVELGSFPGLRAGDAERPNAADPRGDLTRALRVALRLAAPRQWTASATLRPWPQVRPTLRLAAKQRGGVFPASVAVHE